MSIDLKKPVCIHFHIFKNAGSTIDWILEKNFSKNHLTMDDLKDHSAILSWNKILEYLNKYTNFEAFSSHQIRLPIPINTSFQFIPMVFIRHPIDRAFSIYSFKRRSTDDSIGTKMANKLDLAEFIEWNMNLKKYMVMKNFQVLFLSKNDTRIEVDENDFELATIRMKECEIIGIVDRLDESLVVAESILKKFFPKIDLSYVKQNVSEDRKTSLDERLKKDQSSIGEKLTKELERKNILDLRLYEESNMELDRRIKKIENFEEKLINFKDKCHKLKEIMR